MCGLLLALLLNAPTAAAEDSLSCGIDDGMVRCDVDVEEFYAEEIREVLNNGWENTLQFHLVVERVEDEEIMALTFADLSERCYIDPFDNPCRALWSGDEDWESYEDVDELIEGISAFQLVSVPASELGEGEFVASLTVELNPITDEQVNVIRSWLARNRGGHLVVGKNESSIFGTFVSVFANVHPGHAEASVTVESKPFTVPASN